MFGIKKSLIKDTGGAVLAYTAILMPIFLGFIALGLDIAAWHIEKRQSQTIADSAAVAGAIARFRAINEEDDEGTDCSAGSTAFTAAEASAIENNYNSGKGQTLALNCPAEIGDAAGTAGSVEAVVTTPLPIFLAGLVNYDNTGAQASSYAVAGAGLDDACIHGLNQTEASTVVISGGSTLQLDCGVRSESSNDRSINLNGEGSCIDATEVVAVGGADGDCFTPEATTEAPRGNDPLANLPEPSSGGCDHTRRISFVGSSSGTMNPGTYCGDVMINTSGTVTMNAGTYIFNGSAFTVNNGTVNAEGVMLYFTNSDTNDSLDISGGSFNLSAPTSGTYEGIAIYVSRDDTTNYTMTITGGAGVSVTGIIYAKNQDVSFAGQSGSSQSVYIIADKIELTGGSDVNNIDGDGDPIFYSSYLVIGKLVE